MRRQNKALLAGMVNFAFEDSDTLVAEATLEPVFVGSRDAESDVAEAVYRTTSG